MNADQQQIDDAPVQRFEYEDALVLAADVGLGEATVDVVGDTVIVVSDGEQYELTVPADAGSEPRAFIKNGVLTIEVDR